MAVPCWLGTALRAPAPCPGRAGPEHWHGAAWASMASGRATKPCSTAWGQHPGVNTPGLHIPGLHIPSLPILDIPHPGSPTSQVSISQPPASWVSKISDLHIPRLQHPRLSIPVFHISGLRHPRSPKFWVSTAQMSYISGLNSPGLQHPVCLTSWVLTCLFSKIQDLPHPGSPTSQVSQIPDLSTLGLTRPGLRNSGSQHPRSECFGSQLPSIITLGLYIPEKQAPHVHTPLPRHPRS